VATSTVLPIQGYRDEPVPNRFLRPRGAIDRLAVLLPGYGYTLDMPLFYYAENLLLERGLDVLRVEVNYGQNAGFRILPDAEQASWLLADAAAAYQTGLAQGAYRGVALIGKSLGTLAMGPLLTLPNPWDAPRRAVWLTPLLSAERLREQIRQFGGPSLFVIGGADPHYDAAILADLQAATHGEAVVIDGADHGMDIPGNPVASAGAMVRVVDALARFL
jgi:dienelactone hydrolase